MYECICQCFFNIVILVQGYEQDKMYYICLELLHINSSRICSDEGSRMLLLKLLRHSTIALRCCYSKEGKTKMQWRFWIITLNGTNFTVRKHVTKMQNIEMYRTWLSINNVCWNCRISVETFKIFHVVVERTDFDVTFSYPYYLLHDTLSTKSVTPYLTFRVNSCNFQILYIMLVTETLNNVRHGFLFSESLSAAPFK